MWDVPDVGCSGCGMFGMWDVRDVGCSECGMFGMWDVRDVVAGMWDVDLQNAFASLSFMNNERGHVIYLGSEKQNVSIVIEENPFVVLFEILYQLKRVDVLDIAYFLSNVLQKYYF